MRVPAVDEPLRGAGGTASRLDDDGMGDSDGDTAGEDDWERLIDFLDPDPPEAGGKLSAVFDTDWLRVGAGRDDSREGVPGLPLLIGMGDVAEEAECGGCRAVSC